MNRETTNKEYVNKLKWNLQEIDFEISKVVAWLVKCVLTGRGYIRITLVATKKELISKIYET